MGFFFNLKIIMVELEWKLLYRGLKKGFFRVFERNTAEKSPDNRGRSEERESCRERNRLDNGNVFLRVFFLFCF